jgi:hypothetical protein
MGMTATTTSVRPLASAALLVAGGLLGALVPVLHPGHGPGYYTAAATASSHLLLFAAVLLVSLGLPGSRATGRAEAPPGRSAPRSTSSRCGASTARTASWTGR